MKIMRYLTISRIIREAEDFCSFIFEGGEEINYESGQFLTLVYSSGAGEIRRSYSITSSPLLNEPLAIGVKRIDNGFFSRMLVDRARVGDKIMTSGAGGFFRLPVLGEELHELVFFAAGSGITPVLSLIKTALHADTGVKVLLIYSNHSRKTAAYYQQLLALQEKFILRLRIQFLFSDSADLVRARLNRDLFFSLLQREKVSIAQSFFFLCGPPSYMRMLIYLLEELGVAADRVRREDFVPIFDTGYRPLPPDKDAHYMTVHHGAVAHRFPVTYPDSILRAAKALHIELPYSCENGRCGNCAALCVSGKVWLSNNEVLTDEDLAKGLTLTCTGHPLGGDVELRVG